MIVKIKQTLLAIGDIIALYLSLIAALLMRYGYINEEYSHAHLGPFSIIFILWIAIFYIVGLYDIRNLKNTLSFMRKFGVSILAGAVSSITLFYIIPYFHISPKRNLALFLGIFIIVGGMWRLFFNRTIRVPQRRVVLMGEGEELNELAVHMRENPQIGYHVVHHITTLQENQTAQELKAIHHPDTIIISETLHAPTLMKELSSEAMHGIEIIDSTTAYQIIFKKLPLSQMHELWIITRLSRAKRVHETMKQVYEPIAALLLCIGLSPLLLAIYILIISTSRGPGIYKQIRVGKGEEKFWIYKFRTMRVDAEKNGAVFAQKNDTRITKVGTWLRFSHLDELPQIFNVIRGDLSFVGPRPERPEFIIQLKKEIPHYELRHLVRPGITGWAQVNYRANVNLVEDTYHKLQYDMFYIQERSFIFDVLTILKTIKMFLFNYR
ncbi:MAG: sugar transferase [Candidatus Paceibacterota bacterium]